MIFGITIGIGAAILGNFQNTNAVYNTTAANNTVIAVLNAFVSLTNWLGIIILVIVAALILNLLGMFNMGGGKNR